MNLFYAVILEKENDRKPDQYYEMSYRDGRESLNFLFDIINDYAGYTELYYNEMNMSEQEWRDKVKPMRTNYNDPYLQDNFPHILFVIEKPERLLQLQDQRAKDWLDALIIRLYNGERYRKHFPVILESSSWLYFNFELFDRLNLWQLSIPTLDFEGFNLQSITPPLSKIYNIDQIKLIHFNFGNCIYHVHMLTEIAIRSNQKLTSLVERAPIDLPEFTKVRNIFYNRMSKVYLNPKLGPELDSGEIDYLILHVLNLFVKSTGKFLCINFSLSKIENIR